MSLKPFFRWVGTRLGCIMCDAVCSTCQLKNLLSRVGRSQFRHLPKHGLKYKVYLGLGVGLHNICKIQCSFNTSGFTIFHIIPSKRFQSAFDFMVIVGSCIFLHTEIVRGSWETNATYIWLLWADLPTQHSVIRFQGESTFCPGNKDVQLLFVLGRKILQPLWF